MNDFFVNPQVKDANLYKNKMLGYYFVELKLQFIYGRKTIL